MVENRTLTGKMILQVDETKENVWDFYFGRGGASNQKRQVSKANNLVQSLAQRYSEVRQSEKRIFAKIEVYDMVVRNGGHFLLPVNKDELVDVTNDEEEAVSRIMQNFRDINKIRSTSIVDPLDNTTTLVTKFGKSSKENGTGAILGTKKSKTTRTRRRSGSTYSAKFGRRESIEQRPPRPKRRCIRPSIIEPPILENPVGDSMITARGGPSTTTTSRTSAVVFGDKNNSPPPATRRRTMPLIAGMNGTSHCIPHSNRYHASMYPMSANLQGTQDPSLMETAGGTPPAAGDPCLAPANTSYCTTHQPPAGDDDDDDDDNDDAFENKMVVEPPRLENSFSQWIMSDDEIRPDLPIDSQQSINLNLHSRVQRLENLVAMLMQQKNDEMELLLENGRSTNPRY